MSDEEPIAGDAEERRDPMGPPKEPCECWCMHCKRTFTSDLIWFQKVVGDPTGFKGYWRCPTSNCDGAGYTFDIFPTDQDHPDNGSWHYSDDDDEGESDEEDGDWDPAESKYLEMDEELDDEDDMEGEEWKQGLQPGEAVQESPAQAEARRRWEEEQKRYDAPDERPREVQWEERKQSPDDPTFGEDQIPY